MKVGGVAFFAGKLFGINSGPDEPAGKFIEFLQEPVAGFLVLEHSNREGLNVKLFDRTSVGFNLHVSGFSWI
jgi:hypothetical protein